MNSFSKDKFRSTRNILFHKFRTVKSTNSVIEMRPKFFFLFATVPMRMKLIQLISRLILNFLAKYRCTHIIMKYASAKLLINCGILLSICYNVLRTYIYTIVFQRLPFFSKLSERFSF